MKRTKVSEGELYMQIGGLLSGTALLSIFLYQMLFQYIQQNGGTYPSGLFIILGVPVLTFGIVFSFSGARLARSRLGLVTPIVCAGLLLYLIIQYEWCLYYCARP